MFLVTGGCGFIGSHLVAALLRCGHEVRVLDNLSSGSAEHLAAGARLIRGDIRDAAAVAEAMAGAAGCFHLAAIASLASSNADWRESHDVNVAGTIAVLDAARRAGKKAPIRVAFASSASVYGSAGEPPFQETASPRPVSTYGTDKRACELYAGVAAELHGVPSVGLRLFNVFGPHAAAGVVSIFCRRIAEGRTVTIFGDGEQTRDFVHVDDVVAGFLAAMEAPLARPALINICTGQATSVVALAETVAALCRRGLRVEHREAPVGHVQTSVGDPTLARNLLGFAPRTDLAAELAAMLGSGGSRQPGFSLFSGSRGGPGERLHAER